MLEASWNVLDVTTRRAGIAGLYCNKRTRTIGKKLAELDEEHTKGRQVLLVAGDKDDATPRQWSEHMVSQYTNARLKVMEGGHISAIFRMDDIWAEFMDM